MMEKTSMPLRTTVRKLSSYLAPVLACLLWALVLAPVLVGR